MPEWLTWELARNLGAITAGSVPVVVGLHDFIAYRAFKRERNKLELLKLRLETHELNQRLGDPFAPPPLELPSKSDPEIAQGTESKRDEELLKAWREMQEMKELGQMEDPHLKGYRKAPTVGLLLSMPAYGVVSALLLWGAIELWDFALSQLWTIPLVLGSFLLGGFGLMLIQPIGYAGIVLGERLAEREKKKA